MPKRVTKVVAITAVCLMFSGLSLPTIAEEELSVTEQIQLEDEMAELELLAILVRAEAGTQCEEGKRAVAAVVLNRVDSTRFPNTITEVIYSPKQFSVVTDGGLDRAAWTVDETDYNAVAKELKERKYRDCLFFRTQRYHSGRTALYKIGAHYFSK